MGSNPNSWMLYTKTKGQMEESTKGEGFGYTSIFRPGLLDRAQGDPRWVEKFLRKSRASGLWCGQVIVKFWDKYVREQCWSAGVVKYETVNKAIW